MIAVQEQIDEILKSGGRRFTGLHLQGGNFVGQDLKKADFRGASLPRADFTDADCAFANFEGANLTGAIFRKTNCHRTSFKDANLSNAIMEASDLYGATFTMECRSFMGMQVLPGWWWGWVFYALLMKPPDKDCEDRLISAMGSDRYMVLRKMYARRQF